MKTYLHPPVSYLPDLWAILRGDGIALDDIEAAALGGPRGATISLWCAMEWRHGSFLARLACLGLWLVQFAHCRDQLAGVPMRPSNYVRAVVLLVLFAPIVGVVWCVRRVQRWAALRAGLMLAALFAAVFYGIVPTLVRWM